MKLRKVNANERLNAYFKLSVIILAIVLLSFVKNSRVDFTVVTEDNVTEYELDHYSCDEIYDRTMNDTLYADDINRSWFSDDAVILYYVRNCDD